jgi:peptidyl-prolyl cis-trans isomerase A (cyclophilin A)
MRSEIRVLMVSFLLAGLTACGGSQSSQPAPEVPEKSSSSAPAAEAPAAPPSTPTSSSTPAPAAAAAPAESKASPFDPALLNPASLRAKAPKEYEVKFATTQGDFVVKVTRAWAPNGADRFYNLARHHFFDGSSFFRVLPGFVVQFGLSAYPQVSRAWAQAAIKDDPVVQSNHRGFLTFAMAGPNTRTTQVFINLGANERLDQMGFSAFGMVTDGMDVVEKLYSGYGEGAPDGNGPNQELIQTRGRTYLERSFPKLDTIKTATLVSPGAAEK